jgi:hypothetical protein
MTLHSVAIELVIEEGCMAAGMGKFSVHFLENTNCASPRLSMAGQHVLEI